MRKIDRTDETNLNVDGFEMRIIEYNNNKDIIVFFPELDVIRKTRYSLFVSGKVYPTYRNKGMESVKSLPEFEHAYDAPVDTKDEFNVGDNKAVAIALGIGMSAILSIAIGGLILAIFSFFKYMPQ